MNTELAQKVKTELERWSRDDERRARRAGNILIARRHDAPLTLEGSGHGRAAPPVGQRVKRFERYFKEFVAFAKLHGMEQELTDEQAKRAAALLLGLQAFWQKT